MLSIGVGLAVGTPAALLAQATGRPPVVIDRTVLDQLGPPSNLPELLLQQEQTSIPSAKITLTPPHGDNTSRSRHSESHSHGRKLAGEREAGPLGAVHLHPIKPCKKNRRATLTRPSKTAAPSAKTAKPASLTPTLPPTVTPTLTPTLAPTLSPSPAGNPTAPVVTSEPLAAPPEPKAKAPDKHAKTAALIPAEAAPMPPITAPPPIVASTNTPAALTAQPAGSEPAATAATQESLSTIEFDRESARLPDGARDLLAHLASRMTEDATLEVQLLAYAGGNEENASKARRLSLSRALAVRSFLIDQGVRSTRIEVRALGNKVPEGNPERVDIAVQKRG